LLLGLAMRRVKVKSSAINSIGYSADTNVLEVEFVTGRVFQYFFVPAAQHEAFVSAESIGAHFNANIRDRYPFRELTVRGR
jgi:hypothetical protein